MTVINPADIPFGDPSLVPDYSKETYKVHEEDIKLMTREPLQHGILNSIVDAVGSTPIVRLHNIEKYYNISPDVEILAKLEFLSPGGSTKDRVAKAMVERAETLDGAKPGDVFIEATSGNTGIGMAMACAAKGYSCVVCMPQKMSAEKSKTLEAFGTQVIRTPTKAAWNDAGSHIATAYSLKEKMNASGRNAFLPDQYRNPGNPISHYCGTAAEILEACSDKKIDALVASTGTGGTITGLAARFKSDQKDCRIVAVDPEGSILSCDTWKADEIHSYHVEGIGYDFHPTVLDRSLVDEWVKTQDEESFEAARLLIRIEGLLCGGSSGSALVGAIKVAKKMTSGRIVVILPDSIRNYLNKFVDDRWMVLNNFMDMDKMSSWSLRKELWGTSLIKNIVKPLEFCDEVPGSDIVCVPGSEEVGIALKKYKSRWMLVMSEKTNQIIGCLSKDGLLNLISSMRVRLTDDLSSACLTPIVCVAKNRQTMVECSILLEALEENGGMANGILLVVDDESPEILRATSSEPGSRHWRKEVQTFLSIYNSISTDSSVSSDIRSNKHLIPDFIVGKIDRTLLLQEHFNNE